MRPPRKFEDLVLGEERVSMPRLVTTEDILDFARRYDPQWFHTDPDAARQSHFGEVVASGIHILALWRQMDHEINSDIDFVCGVGWDDLRLRRAVRGGDSIHARSRIVDLQPSASGKPRGTVIMDYAVRNQHGEDVVTFRSINLVYSRAAFSD